MGAGELLCLFLVVPDVFLVSGRRAPVGPGAKPKKQSGTTANSPATSGRAVAKAARLCLVVLFFPLLASARLFSARLVSSLLCSSRLFSALFFSSLFCSSLLGCIPLRLVRRVEGLRGPER